jgi:hypothetical protein
MGGEITKESKEDFFILQYPENEAGFALRRFKYAPQKKNTSSTLTTYWSA